MRHPPAFALASLACLLALDLPAQGPGSCGFHLDIDADLTSTHSAVADLPFAPGSGPVGYPPPLPGNPYAAYATPGTTVKLKLSVPPSVLGPAPIGAGSTVTIFWALATPPIPVPPPPFPAAIPACVPGQPWIITVLPIGGAIVDGNGFVVPIPPFTPPAADPGHPHKLEVTLLVPLGLPAGLPVMFQAAAITPIGALAVSNGVALFAGPNLAEISLLPAVVAFGGPGALDDGVAPGIPTPPGFMFYGFPAPVCNVNTNGFLDFLFAPVAVPDVVGTAGDLGCAPVTPTASPRLAVNHFDADFTPAPPPGLIDDLTMEFAPPGPFWPSRLLIRWKNVANFGLPAGLDSNHSSMVAELWGMDGPGGMNRLVAVRQEMHSVYSLANHDLVGIGPGIAGQGFGGPAPACAAIVLPGIYGIPGPIGVPGGGLYMDTAPAVPGLLNSHMLSNLAVAFDPLGFGPLLPYSVNVY